MTRATMLSPLFSVVIPTCQRNSDLAQCLGRLARGRDSSVEVVVTDDGSTNTAESLLRRDFPWVRWTAGPRRGPAANRNHGAEIARGEWLVFLDDDCLPEPQFLNAYRRAARKAPVLEGRTSPFGVRTRVDMECPANERGGFLWSCNFAIRRDLFAALGGFDEHFPGPAMEDVDFRMRLLTRGIETAFVPAARVFHAWRQRKGMAFIRLHSASVAYYVTKHPESRAQFSLLRIGHGLLHRFGRQLPPVAVRCRFRGLARECSLALYAAFCVTRSVRRVDLERSTNHEPAGQLLAARQSEKVRP